MEEETTQFESERNQRVKELGERQARELDNFDEASTKMGFSLQALSSPGSFQAPDLSPDGIPASNSVQSLNR